MNASRIPLVFLSLFALLSLANSSLAQPAEEAKIDEVVQKAVDASIEPALRFLALEQRDSGAWQVHRRDSHAATGLAVMAFLAAGHLPDEGPYGKVIRRGVNWVIANQHPSGVLSEQGGNGMMYCHGIATLMLGEVIGLMPEQEADACQKAFRDAVRIILLAQTQKKSESHRGGWRYGPKATDSDLSVTGWQLLALKAAKNVGCDVPAENIDAAVDYVRRCGASRRGFGYTPFRRPTPTMTGTGILAMEVCGQHQTPEVMAAARQLLARPLRPHDSYFFYGAYYNAVGMFKVGGEYWTTTYRHVAETLIEMQKADGSWSGRGSEASAGEVYATSLAVLALAVDYRYLPIYQR